MSVDPFHRIAVVYLPSTRAQEWRSAVTAQALANRWTILDQELSHPSSLSDTGPFLIHCHDASNVLIWNADEIIILKDSADNTIAAVHQRPEDLPDAVRFASMKLAQASELALQPNVSVLDVRIEVAAIGRLGAVSVSKPGPIGASKGPLSFYDAVPPQAGAPSSWPAYLSFPGQHNHNDKIAGLMIDLTGRRRLLQFGPFVTLSQGAWEARAKVAVAVRSGPIDLRFEWGVGHDVALSSRTIVNSGIYEVTLLKTWHAPAPVELRIWLDRAMFDGGFELLDFDVRLAAVSTHLAA